ncbi:MFS transporter [Enterobacter sp. ENT03]|uniref:MFS transporter n=1 Tax=Enterobacter sp. ENT03 TaxID=2854780 RepID=UPI001C43EB8B|nr:glycoside-pentoside-hexuronide (GPH):cation symporter [Enterobacter sp. ENT03]MBV7405148.1 glycoside-pentoside-hexuronide (GPH):cation symporter [Enterobacter sp. ENT03]
MELTETVKNRETYSRDKVSWTTAISYGLGSYGANVMYAFIAIYLMLYYTDSLGIKAAAVGLLFLIARLVDGATDIALGILVDNTHTKLGKFRPWILVGSILVSLTTVACFLSPDFSEAGKLVYAYSTYILWSVCFAVIDIPYWSLSAAITQDPTERSKVITIPRIIATFGFLTVSASTLWLVKFVGSWWGVSLIFSAIFLVCMLITFFGVKEKYAVPRKERQNFKGFWLLLKQNNPLRYLLIGMLMLELIGTIRGTFQLYFFIYNLNAEAALAAFLTVSMIAQVAGTIASPFISVRIGKKNTAIYSSVMMSLSCIVLFFCQTNITLIFIIGALAPFFGGVGQIALYSMVADCVEYGEWVSGNRSEGMVFSLNIFKTKLSGAIGGAIGGFCLSWAGYIPHTVQSAQTALWIGLFFTLIPGILTVLSLFPLAKYEITEKRFFEILDEIRQRHHSVKEIAS